MAAVSPIYQPVNTSHTRNVGGKINANEWFEVLLSNWDNGQGIPEFERRSLKQV